MAFDAFLKIDGVNGESTRKGFEKQIEIQSFSWELPTRLLSEPVVAAAAVARCRSAASTS